MVIAEDATSEALRLKNDGLPIAQMALTRELSCKLAEIDGAILCSPNGICHAVAVILDGTAVISADRGRGSRFNSAIRYVTASTASRAAMVVSEDGGIDLLPKLRPALGKVELSLRLRELEFLARSASTPPDRGREADVIRWIEGHSYYLSAEQCAKIDEWIKSCDENHPKGSVWIVHNPLTPNPEFDPTRDLM